MMNALPTQMKPPAHFSFLRPACSMPATLWDTDGNRWRCETCGRLALITRSKWAFRQGSSNASLPVHGHWHALCRMPGTLNRVSTI